jgi:hypothetical protein
MAMKAGVVFKEFVVLVDGFSHFIRQLEAAKQCHETYEKNRQWGAQFWELVGGARKMWVGGEERAFERDIGPVQPR